MALLPTGIAVWWMLRTLPARFTTSEARGIATAFMFSTPLSMVIGTEFSAGLGGYYIGVLGYLGGLAAGICGLFAISTLVSVAFCLPALWFARYLAQLESAGYPNTTPSA